MCLAKAPVQVENAPLIHTAPLGVLAIAGLNFGFFRTRVLHLRKELADSLVVGQSLPGCWETLIGDHMEVYEAGLLQNFVEVWLERLDLGCSNLVGVVQDNPGSDVCCVVISQQCINKATCQTAHCQRTSQMFVGQVCLQACGPKHGNGIAVLQNALKCGINLAFKAPEGLSMLELSMMQFML